MTTNGTRSDVYVEFVNGKSMTIHDATYVQPFSKCNANVPDPILTVSTSIRHYVIMLNEVAFYTTTESKQ